MFQRNLKLVQLLLGCIRAYENDSLLTICFTFFPCFNIFPKTYYKAIISAIRIFLFLAMFSSLLSLFFAINIQLYIYNVMWDFLTLVSCLLSNQRSQKILLLKQTAKVLGVLVAMNIIIL